MSFSLGQLIRQIVTGITNCLGRWLPKILPHLLNHIDEQLTVRFGVNHLISDDQLALAVNHHLGIITERSRLNTKSRIKRAG